MLVAGAVAAAAGCGGGGGSSQTTFQRVLGSHFIFESPSSWEVSRVGTQVSLAPKPVAPELVSVSVFPLLRVYRPALYAAVTKELDSTAGQLATRLKGTVVDSRTVEVAGDKVRQYQIEYSSGGQDYEQLITFVLRGKTEYQLLCRWTKSEKEPDACTRLVKTFTPT
jgi:hypothetical protein